MEMNRFEVERKDEENAAVGDRLRDEAKEFLILLIKKRFYYRKKVLKMNVLVCEINLELRILMYKRLRDR